MKREHKRWGQPEENAFRETIRFHELYWFDTLEDYEDHRLRQQYLYLWMRGLMSMELTEEQEKAMIEVVEKIVKGEKHQPCEDCGEGDECDTDANKEMVEKLKEINKPSKDKLRYVS